VERKIARNKANAGLGGKTVDSTMLSCHGKFSTKDFCKAKTQHLLISEKEEEKEADGKTSTLKKIRTTVWFCRCDANGIPMKNKNGIVTKQLEGGTKMYDSIAMLLNVLQADNSIGGRGMQPVLDPHREITKDVKGTSTVRWKKNKKLRRKMSVKVAELASQLDNDIEDDDASLESGSKRQSVLNEPKALAPGNRKLGAGVTQKISDATKKELMAFEWYKPTMNRSDADAYLEGKPAGTFVLRESSRPGSFAISVSKGGTMPYRGLINPINDGYRLMAQTRFKSIPELITFHRTNPITTIEDGGTDVFLKDEATDEDAGFGFGSDDGGASFLGGDNDDLKALQLLLEKKLGAKSGAPDEEFEATLSALTVKIPSNRSKRQPFEPAAPTLSMHAVVAEAMKPKTYWNSVQSCWQEAVNIQKGQNAFIDEKTKYHTEPHPQSAEIDAAGDQNANEKKKKKLSFRSAPGTVLGFEQKFSLEECYWITRLLL
jgi:hypothetical protein